MKPRIGAELAARTGEGMTEARTPSAVFVPALTSDVSLFRNALVEKSLLAGEADEYRARYVSRQRATLRAKKSSSQRTVRKLVKRFVEWGAPFTDSILSDRYRINEQLRHRRATTEFDKVYAAFC